MIDASRISDGRLVYIKRVKTGGDEERITSMLSKAQDRSDAVNHCVPLLDLILDEEDAAYSYLVLPFLRPVDNPSFETVNDVVDFVEQILQVCSFTLVNRSY